MHGIPLALKDNIDTAGIRTTAATLSLLFVEAGAYLKPTVDADQRASRQASPRS